MSLVTRSGPADTDLFFNPPNLGGGYLNFTYDNVYNLGSTFSLEWATNATNFEIQFWQQWLSGAGASKGPTIYTPYSTSAPVGPYAVQTFNWSIQTYEFSLTKSPIFFFWAFSGQQSLFSSHYFNITNNDTTESISSTITPLATTSATSIAPSNTTQGPNPGVSNHHASNPVSENVGIGIGAAAFALILIALMWNGLRRYRRRQSRSLKDKNNSRRLQPQDPHFHNRHGPITYAGDTIEHAQWPVELPDKTPTYLQSRFPEKHGFVEKTELSARRSVAELGAPGSPRILEKD